MSTPSKLAAFTPEGARLFLLGFLTLFLELALIRYLSGNIWNLGYFPNIVLIAVFVGMGLGFTFHHHATERASKGLYQAGIWVVLALVAYVAWKRPTVPGFSLWEGNLGGDLYFTVTPPSVLQNTALAFIFCVAAIVVTFAFISQRTAKYFRQFEPLTAYTLDIAGSCTGIVVFMLISWQAVPAAAWFAFFTLLYLAAGPTGRIIRWLPALAGIALTALVAHQDTHLVVEPSYDGPMVSRWSPYQKVEYIDIEAARHRIFVNGINHQHMELPEKLRDSFYWPIHGARAEDPNHPPYRNVLILGSGSGNDVATALLGGAEHVDAVEIDPVIAELGREYAPHGAYLDERVSLHIDDGRAFLTRADQQYDLIIFALTDSLVKVSSMSQLRLENYLFTKESVTRAYELLAPGGDVVFYNYYRQPWLKEKIEQMALAATGSTPRLVYRDKDFYVLAVQKTTERAEPAPQVTANIPTDDWPFLYLETRGIPQVYRWAMLGMASLVLALLGLLHATTRRLEGLGGRRMLYIKLAFVLMGVAFLLLETKSIIQFSLLFGTTWENNSLVFLGVLLLVLGANWTAVAMKGARWLWLIIALLMGSTLLNLVFPLGDLLHVESGLLRFVLASLLTFSPIFFANLVFSISFRDLEIAEHVFGWNLIGATLGGVAEYASMAMGYQFLAVVVAVCYALVALMLFLARRQPEGS